MKVLIEFVWQTAEQWDPLQAGLPHEAPLVQAWVELPGFLPVSLGGRITLRFADSPRAVESLGQMQRVCAQRARAGYGMDLLVAFEDDEVGGTLLVRAGAWRVLGMADWRSIEGETVNPPIAKGAMDGAREIGLGVIQDPEWGRRTSGIGGS